MNTYVPIFRGLDAHGGRKLRTDTHIHTHTHGTTTVTLAERMISANIVELFRSYFSKLASSNIDSSSPTSHVSDDMDMLEAISFTHDDQILDTDIIMEEIEAAFIALKCGRSKRADGLNSEHLTYGGDSLKLWLKKIFNTIVSLERGSIDKPLTFDVGLIQLSFIPVCSPNTCSISVKLCRVFTL